jgi:DHA1 family tetracycline resistance protein-like MFS transporter
MAPAFKNRNALAFVLITVMINSIGFGIIIPVLPDLIRELTTIPDNQLALHMGGLTFVFAVMQFICMPIIGGLSDRYGRRPIMLLSLFGLGVDYLVMGFAPFIFVLYMGRVVAGALGATFTTANAYIADVSPPETRAQNFGLVGAAFGVGFMLGPAIGGILGDETKFLGELASPRLPFIAAGVLSMLNVLFGMLVLPETLPEAERRPFSLKRSNPLGALKSLGKVSGARGLIFVMFLLGVAHTVYPTTYAISTQVKLGWSSGDVGLSLLAFGLASFIVQGGLIRVIIPKTGLFWAGIIGIVAAAIAYAGMGLANVGWVIYAMGPFAAFAGLYNPALNNMMSSQVSRSEQGELQGAIGAAQGMALMIGPLMMSGTFFVFAKTDMQFYQPGAPFILAAILVVISFASYIIVTSKVDRQSDLPTTHSE